MPMLKNVVFLRTAVDRVGLQEMFDLFEVQSPRHGYSDGVHWPLATLQYCKWVLRLYFGLIERDILTATWVYSTTFHTRSTECVGTHPHFILCACVHQLRGAR